MPKLVAVEHFNHCAEIGNDSVLALWLKWYDAQDYGFDPLQ